MRRVVVEVGSSQSIRRSFSWRRKSRPNVDPAYRWRGCCRRMPQGKSQLLEVDRLWILRLGRYFSFDCRKRRSARSVACPLYSVVEDDVPSPVYFENSLELAVDNDVDRLRQRLVEMHLHS
ncbi:hypothetical protein NP493_1552g00004 [Ridgeia piscesae]|uniref:Uncharacterized protein n=1 Tax=Ridgeia piscesae TaxID=27915 RepID=A0AAD9N9K5_RIDPI|nr:hypothetical protein NP493_1552g00004 [Ridgeia piscesae]